jgi:hypothetical protein
MKDAMSRLESAIHEAFNLAFMLAATLDDGSSEDEKRDALAFGILKLLDFTRETKKLYEQLHNKMRQGNVVGQEAVLRH